MQRNKKVVASRCRDPRLPKSARIATRILLPPPSRQMEDYAGEMLFRAADDCCIREGSTPRSTKRVLPKSQAATNVLFLARQWRLAPIQHTQQQRKLAENFPRGKGKKQHPKHAFVGVAYIH